MKTTTVSGPVAHVKIIGAIFAVISICSHADQLPNQVDLKAMYCNAVLKKELAVMTAESPRIPEYAKPVYDKSVNELNSKLRRIQLYLLPRMPYLDSLALLAAGKSGEEDWVQGSRDTNSCAPTCLSDVECLTKCAGKSPAVMRVRSCQNLSFLPF